MYLKKFRFGFVAMIIGVGIFSEVIGSEGPATDVGIHQLPFGKYAMLIYGGADHPVSALPRSDSPSKESMVKSR